jgi:hypothetical protein
MATTLKYNGLTILNCLTREFSQEVVYDDSGTDPLYEKVRITVEGVMHGLAVNGSGYLSGGAAPAVGLSPTKGDLERNLIYFAQTFAEPRKELEYKAAGVTLLRVAPHDGKASTKLDPFSATETNSRSTAYPDVHNGPKPQTFRVLKIYGDKTLEIEFTIECCIVRCAASKNTKGILNNRWSVRDTIDDNWFCTRHYEGTLVVAHPDIDADSFRGILIPPLEKGFTRQDIETTTDPTGLRLTYQVTDRQTSNTPPFPATKWSGSHRVQSGFDGNGMSNQVSVSVDLWGPEGTSKDDLIALAAAICRDRTNYRAHPGVTAKSQAPTLVNNLEIIDHLDENHVAMHLTVTLPAKTVTLATIDLTLIGSPLNLPKYDRLVARAPSVYGTASTTGRLICYLQTPCDDEHETKLKLKGEADRPTSFTGGDGTNVRQYTGTVPEEAPVQAPYDKSHEQAQYTHYRIDNEYVNSVGRVVLPVANKGGTPSPGDRTVYLGVMSQAAMLRIVRVTAERLGEWPKIPKPKDFKDQNGIDHYLVDSRQIAAAPQLTADGVNSLYTITIEYTFSMSRPLLADEVISSGSLPWDVTTPAKNVIKPSAIYPQNNSEEII